MSKKFFITILIVFNLILFSSCSSDDTIQVDITSIQEITNTAKSGTWIITNYTDSGTDETTDYDGYNFDFAESGQLSSSNGITTINGSWSITDDSGSTSQGDIDFNIFFSAPDNFADLSDDWDIVSISSNKIELIDISGGSGETDSLTFIKN